MVQYFLWRSVQLRDFVNKLSLRQLIGISHGFWQLRRLPARDKNTLWLAKSATPQSPRKLKCDKCPHAMTEERVIPVQQWRYGDCEGLYELRHGAHGRFFHALASSREFDRNDSNLFGQCARPLAINHASSSRIGEAKESQVLACMRFEANEPRVGGTLVRQQC